MVYSTAGHHLSQVNTADANGVLRLFTDSIAAHVALTRLPAAQAAFAVSQRGRGGADVQSNCTSADAQSTTEYSVLKNQVAKTETQKHVAGNAFSKTGTDYSAIKYDISNTTCEISKSIIPWDCELARLCDNRDETLLFRLLGYAHVLAHGSGKIAPDELFVSIGQLGIECSRRTFDTWLQRGNRLYWHKRGGYLYLTGWKKLARKLTKWAAKYHPEWIATNLPGQQRVKLDLTGDAQQVRAHIYGGWLTVKAARNGYIDISRYTLGILWRRSRKALRRYEKMLGIRVQERYAEDGDTTNPLIPAHAYLCLDTQGSDFASWRLSNRYIPSFADIHPCNGQRRKVRRACRSVVESTNPAIQSAGGAYREQRTGKLYFEDRQTKRGLKLAHKTLGRHLRKHQDAGIQPHYCYTGQRYGKHIYEASTGNRLRGLQIERDRVGEQSDAFTERRSQWRRYWGDRGKSTLV